ncbi:addiction module toxin RelE [Enterobacteriaceae bacterium ENNIH3]|nr:addiction module toxin RelE [Enterobacteriaceae bacterium ENNIH3]AUV05953.1 addiction module toxin RelE [Enterobacteriaceae bacterium ENNIH2]PWF52608.1 addiction module toxin RelE [[Kluyvera] intestini]
MSQEVRIVKYVVYTKSFVLHQGGKDANPQELTKVSDWGAHPQPTKRQREG